MYWVKRAVLLMSVCVLLIAVTTTSLAGNNEARRKWSIQPLALQVEKILTGKQRSWTFKATGHDTVLLAIEARLDWPRLAGSFQAMQLEVNHMPVTADFLINKPAAFTYPDGRTYNYYQLPTPDVSTPGWMLQYSPDFESNNVAGPSYQVLEGQAYLYIFDITPLVRSGKMTTLTLTNRSEVAAAILGQPIPLAFRQVKLLMRGDKALISDVAQ